jgi:FkbM family methyltransferase
MRYVKKIMKFLRLMIFPSTKNWSEQDYRMFKFYSAFINKGDCCFDIGANVGNRTRIFLGLGAKVVAVEPQKGCVAELYKIKSRRLHIMQKVLGASEGTTELLVSDAAVLSTLSLDWMNAVRRSGRFSSRIWERKQTVAMTTLDSLIREFGMPSFIKIDVEGFEREVLRGLSRPVPALSFEFTPEILNTAVDCVRYLTSLDKEALFNYSLNESMELALPNWVPSEEIVLALKSYENNVKVFGDVYARLHV